MRGRRTAATKLDIAKTAVVLFAEHGTYSVTAREIAVASGVSLRTFYRYFPTKEDAVGPVLFAGAAQWQSELASLDKISAVHMTGVIRQILTPADAAEADQLRIMARLLRVAQEDQLLRDVWSRVNQQSERALVDLLEGTFGAEVMSRRIVAAAATSAIRIALEMWALSEFTDDTNVPAAWACDAFARLSRGAWPEPADGAEANL
ncbi:TetR family transcriptional regulator [Arthrobacter russicus]